MNTAINAYISNYECCYSRDGNGCRSREKFTEKAEGEKGSMRNRDRKVDTAGGVWLQLSFVCALIRLSRPSDLCVRFSEITKLWEVTVGAMRTCIYTSTSRENISRDCHAKAKWWKARYGDSRCTLQLSTFSKTSKRVKLKQSFAK